MFTMANIGKEIMNNSKPRLISQRPVGLIIIDVGDD